MRYALAALALIAAAATAPAAEVLDVGEGDAALNAVLYRPQGAGLLSFDFSAHPPVVLQAGRRYALALESQKGALTINLRASRGDVYADGEASLDDRPLKDSQGRPADFAFALYAR